MATIRIDHVSSPVGKISLASDGERLCALGFGAFGEGTRRLLAERYGEAEFVEANDPNGFSARLRAYFQGELGALDDISVSTGGTRFQQDVWTALRLIPAGATATYGEIAVRVGRPAASRAVGLAAAHNPVAIAVPCHRVVGATGRLVGYAGGLERKRWLLAHEGALLAA